METPSRTSATTSSCRRAARTSPRPSELAASWAPTSRGRARRARRTRPSCVEGAREKWAFWIKLYQQKRLSQGEYLGALYDIGFDRPEAHAVRKGDALYYAFFADRFRGKVELRGLTERRYRVRDYETGRDFGSVSGPRAFLEAPFKGHLLLEAQPE